MPHDWEEPDEQEVKEAARVRAGVETMRGRLQWGWRDRKEVKHTDCWWALSWCLIPGDQVSTLHPGMSNYAPVFVTSTRPISCQVCSFLWQWDPALLLLASPPGPSNPPCELHFSQDLSLSLPAEWLCSGAASQMLGCAHFQGTPDGPAQPWILASLVMLLTSIFYSQIHISSHILPINPP